MPASEIAQRHVPVLLERCLDLIAPALTGPDAVLVDATLGMGGHTHAALARFEGLTVVGIDRDPQAIEFAGERLKGFGDRFRAHYGRYDQIPEALAGQGFDHANAVLMDLGVSSWQLDSVERGFAYSKDSPLDMRMDSQQALTAETVVNTYSVPELTRVLRQYGEEKFAHRVANAIARRREEAPIVRSSELVDIIRDAIPAAARRTGGNPAKRSFQGIRIEVNSELDALSAAIPAALDAIPVGGRVVVMAYHSLEDRIVKKAMVRGILSSAPPDMPIEPETHKPFLRSLTRGAEEASEPERLSNPRSASVRLRAVERIRSTPIHLASRSSK